MNELNEVRVSSINQLQNILSQERKRQFKVILFRAAIEGKRKIGLKHTDIKKNKNMSTCPSSDSSTLSIFSES